MQNNESKDYPCIFGEEVHKKCSVRMALTKENSADISKWVKNQDSTYDAMGQLIEQIGEANNALVAFCDMCPHLTLYLERNSLTAQDRLRK